VADITVIAVEIYFSALATAYLFHHYLDGAILSFPDAVRNVPVL
jgi:hypothetical protein